jgi:hypothetical protein
MLGIATPLAVWPNLAAAERSVPSERDAIERFAAILPFISIRPARR